MPNFWDAASAGFQRGVPLGADFYQRALDNARQAREEARQQALDKEKRGVQQRATRLPSRWRSSRWSPARWRSHANAPR